MDFIDYANAIIRDGLSGVTHRYYSIYRAIVVSNQDPMALGRVQISCTTVGHTTTAYPMAWVAPAMAGAGAGRGMFFAPEAGDTVWVSFYEGDPSNPEVYFGGWYGMSTGPANTSSDVPQFLQPSPSPPAGQTGSYPEKKGFTSRAGHTLVFNDTPGSESVTLVYNTPSATDPYQTNRAVTANYNLGTPDPAVAFPGQTIGAAVLNMDRNGVLLKTPSSFVFQIDESKGAITLACPNGSMISFAPTTGNIQIIHASGSSILMSATAITVSGTAAQQVNVSGQSVSLNAGALNLGSKAADFAVLGLKLIAWLAKHTHPYSFGTTLPPLPPPTPADFCSQTVKVQQ